MVEEKEVNQIKNYTFLKFEEISGSYRELLKLKLKNLQCKHIAKINNTTNGFYELAKKVGYENKVLIGSARGNDLSIEINRITSMVNSSVLRPIRIVIDKNKNIWSDNTHWTLAYMSKFGEEVMINDVPFYIVDISKKNPVIISYKNTVIENDTDIKTAIACAIRINHRLDNGWRNPPISYTIQDLSKHLLKEIKND